MSAVSSPIHAFRWTRAGAWSIAHRLAYFWLVWSALLLVHEGGHVVSARRQGFDVRRVTVGMGPVLWRGDRAGTEVVLRLVPLAGVTTFRSQRIEARATGLTVPQGGTSGGSVPWTGQLATLVGGLVATLALAAIVAIAVAIAELATRRRWVLGRMLVADAMVLTVFNFLPVPPLDGGRALLGALTTWRGPLAPDALFWVQAGGLALAVVPMTLWTRWTARIDAVAMRWRVPDTSR